MSPLSSYLILNVSVYYKFICLLLIKVSVSSRNPGGRPCHQADMAVCFTMASDKTGKGESLASLVEPIQGLEHVLTNLMITE